MSAISNIIKIFSAKTKGIFIKRIFFCVECDTINKSRFCDNCNKETGNLFKLTVCDEIKHKESLGLKQKRFGFKKFIRKSFQGFQWSVNLNKHPRGVERHMNIDRENNWYDETVRDNKTGKVFRDVHEPLSEHISSIQKRRESKHNFDKF